jgi:hypothetical protein
LYAWRVGTVGVLLVLPAVVSVLVGDRAGAAQARAGKLPAVIRTWVPARHSPCDLSKPGPFVYHWPVKPFGRQHPIRGNFGDPRTVTTATFGEDSLSSLGSFAFHNGVDISAVTGTPVYPVVSGKVENARYGDEVTIVTDDFRTFQYFHIKPRVRTGQRVVAYRTILGTVLPEWFHVHLSEIDGFRVHNPVDPGHLEPYHDHTIPQTGELLFTDAAGNSLDPGKLHGKILIAADAEDAPPLPVFPRIWFNFPVTPALVAWRIASKTATVVPETVVADFRQTEPANRDFWDIFADGTYQNFPVFAHRYYFRVEGRYLFKLTPDTLDTRRLRNGTYGITVDVADVCGNKGSITEQVTIHN